MDNDSNKNYPIMDEMRFLSDQPINADREQEMRFGHLSIVENLKKIISICSTPFTIGLFGKWGTGKTTILESLNRKFHASEIAVVIIDAWKHEGDALRRTFLQDTLEFLVNLVINAAADPKTLRRLIDDYYENTEWRGGLSRSDDNRYHICFEEPTRKIIKIGDIEITVIKCI